MTQGRRRLRRFLALVALAIFVYLLLLLNGFLPGTWPGGGGGAGLRAREHSRTTDPTRVEPSKSPQPEPEPPLGQVRVTIRAPDGTPLPHGTLSAGSALGGNGAVIGARAVERGFWVDDGANRPIPHGAPPRVATREWVVQWPRATLPAASPGREREIVVTDEAGKPIAAARISVAYEGRERSLSTGSDGRATLPRDSRVFRVCVTAEGHGDVCTYATEDQPGPVEVRLPGMVKTSTRFVDPETHEPLVARALRIVTRDGVVTTLPPTDTGFPGFEGTTPADQAASESLEIEVTGRPTLRLPLIGHGAETAVPRGKSVQLTVHGSAGTPVAGAQVVATYAPPGDVESGPLIPVRETATTDAEGKATIPLPTDRVADLIVETEALAPSGLRIPAADAAAQDVLLEGGASVPVRVTDLDGAPIRGAEVVILARAGAESLRRSAKTDAGGLANLPPVTPGKVEVYAHAPGFAWDSVRAEAASGMATVGVRLPRGARLLLVVEDAYGAPLPGVRVSVMDDGAAGRRPEGLHDGPDPVRWVTDESGVLQVDDVPARPVDLSLEKRGYQDEVVRGVRPGPTTWFATMVKKE